MQISEARKKVLRDTLRTPVFRIFNDAAMAGFAVILAFIIFLPLVFHFSPLMLTLFDEMSYII